MRAVILLAGLGSRLHPLTIDRPKALLPIGQSTVLEHMISKLQSCGVSSFVIVCGHMQAKIKEYVSNRFTELDVIYVRNDQYLTTNTGYSLLCAREHLENHSFIKLDGDVIFDEEIMKRLIATDSDSSYVCIDKTYVDDEVIKVSCGNDGNIIRVSNTLPVLEATGESIGIEKISAQTAPVLFQALEDMMQITDNHQHYYENAYDEIIQAKQKFKPVDITGLNWVEMDSPEDYAQAQSYFGD